MLKIRKFRLNSGICALWLLICAGAGVAGAAPRYTISSVNGSTVTISFVCQETRQSNSGESHYDTLCIGFAASPNVSEQISIKSIAPDSSKVIVPVIKNQAGWSGATYVRWNLAVLTSAHTNPADYTAHGSITITYKDPAINAQLLSKAIFKSGMLTIPGYSPVALKKTLALPSIPYTFGVRIEVTTDGIYEISAAALAQLGVPLSRVSSRYLRLFERDREIPIYITNSYRQHLEGDDKILFYGKQLYGTTSYYTQYSNSNMYWLTWDGAIAGTRIVEVSGQRRKSEIHYTDPRLDTAELAAREFTDTVHIEQDNDIRWLGSIAQPIDISDSISATMPIDNWYWDFVGENDLTNYNISFPAPSTTPSQKAVLKIGLMGLTSSTTGTDDHRYTILVNGTLIDRQGKYASWTGQSPYIYESDSFSVGLIKPGDNMLSFQRVVAGTTDLAALNWVEIRCMRSFTAVNDRILFSNNPQNVNNVFQFSVNGFSTPDIDLWDLATHRLFSRYDVAQNFVRDATSYSALFEDSLAWRSKYCAQSRALRIAPASMKLDTIRSLFDTLANVDYVIISQKSFFGSFAPLVNYYRSTGLTVALVDITDIYNRFSYGTRDPEDIRSMLRHLFSTSTSRRPRYVLLGGDATHDLDKKNPGHTIVPTHMAQVPHWGPSSSDKYFSLINGDDQFPDLSIGRLPATTTAEIDAMVSKIIRSQKTPTRGPWHDRLMLLGGFEPEFTAFNSAAASEYIGDRFGVIRMDADTGSNYYKSDFAAAADIADQINTGVYAINFNGHGGGNVWSDSRFFSYGDISRLYNGQWQPGGRFPFVFSFTCLTGFFESTTYRSLGEELVRADNRGALAFYGASAYTSKIGNIIMNRIMLSAACSGVSQSIGECIAQTDMEMLVRYGSQYIPLVFQYNLLGDPALIWAPMADSLKLTLSSQNLTSADTLKISGSSQPVQSGSVQIHVTSDNQTLSDKTLAIGNGTFSSNYLPKSSTTTAAGRVRAIAWNDSFELVGWQSFAKDTLAILSSRLTPASPSFGDSVVFSASCVLPPTLSNASLYCLWAIGDPSAGTSGLSFAGVPMFSDNDTTWKIAVPIPLLHTGTLDDQLIIKVRVVAGVVSKESSWRIYNIKGLPDLKFMTDTTAIVWTGDSLAVRCNIINSGNKIASHVSGYLAWTGSPTDTIRTFSIPTPLAPGATTTLLLTLPDSQATSGALSCTIRLNSNQSLREISYSNNGCTALGNIRYKECAGVADTVFSTGRGCGVSLAMAPTSSKRIFLFSRSNSTQTYMQPLKTASSWIPLTGDSIAFYSCVARPAFGAADSCVWTWFPADTAVHKKLSGGITGLFTFDSTIMRWHVTNKTSGSASTPISFVVSAQQAGPYGLGTFTDIVPPEFRMSVGGRDFVYLDYAAKDKPFTALIRDQSEVLPSSIKISINNQPLDTMQYSPASAAPDLASLPLTIYAQKRLSIDTLTIEATDCAGNSGKRSFAYLPGENLSASFLSCHPNPFTAEANVSGAIRAIRFAFVLTDEATEATLTIYTVAGRPIRSWKYQSIIGYNEIEWDGRTTDGYRIANGTYYAKLVAQNSSKKVIKTIRIAKLEGF